MNQDCNFYICPTCFNVSEKPAVCHDRTMIHCRSLRPGDPRLKPLLDDDGRITTRGAALVYGEPEFAE